METTPVVILDNDENKDPEVQDLSTQKAETEPAAPDKKQVEKKRSTLIANFTITEYAELEKVINGRIAAGISSDRNQFVRQCIDFAVNHNHFVEKKGYVPGESAMSFGVPDNTRVNLANAIFKPEDF